MIARVTNIAHARETRRTCQSCGLRWNRLFDTFVNRLGWVRRCGKCCEEGQTGAPRAYTGPYPIIGARP